MKPKILIIDCPGYTSAIRTTIQKAISQKENMVIIDNSIECSASLHPMYHEIITQQQKQHEIDLLNQELKTLSKVKYNPKLEKNKAKINHLRKPRKLFQ